MKLANLVVGLIFALMGCAHGPTTVSESPTRHYLDGSGRVWVEGGLWLEANLGDAAGSLAGCVSVPSDPEHSLLEGRICLTRLRFEQELMKPGPRDGYLVRIDPTKVPTEIERLYIHLQPAGEEPLPNTNPCEWTREHQTCAFSTPAGWGMGFAVSINKPSNYHFWEGDVEIALNGQTVTTQTAFHGGPNNIRIYTSMERPIRAAKNCGPPEGAMPIVSKPRPFD